MNFFQPFFVLLFSPILNFPKEKEKKTPIQCRVHIRPCSRIHPQSPILSLGSLHTTVDLHSSVRFNQSTVFFSHTKPAPATSYQPASSAFLSQQISTSHQPQLAEQSDRTKAPFSIKLPLVKMISTVCVIMLHMSALFIFFELLPCICYLLNSCNEFLSYNAISSQL